MLYRGFAAAITCALATTSAIAQQRPPIHSADAPATSSNVDTRLKLYDIDHPADFKPNFANKDDWERRAAFLKRQVAVANGLWPMPERTPLKAVVHGKIDRGEYTVEKVYFASLPGHYVSGNLYRPTKPGKHPVVLCPHGHWTDGRLLWTGDAAAKKQVEIGAEKTIEGARSMLQARCAMLARMGCVVFHYDMVGYADSKNIVHRKGFTDVESVLRLQSQMGLQTWNGIRSLDFVSTLEDVDMSRVAVTGASGGGTQTFILAAVDDRVTVSFPAVMVSTAMQGGCVCENAPLLRVGTNNVELAATFAPKPMAMTAANDWTKDLETRGLPELKAIYKLYDAEENVAGKHFPFEHNYNQVSREMMYGWFNTHLRLGLPTPVTEVPFVPVLPKDLSVYDADHPLPADATDATGVRKYWTESSDARLAALAKQPEAYRKVVGEALRAMVVSDMSLKGKLDVDGGGGGSLSVGTMIESGLVSRKDGGGAIPFVILTPVKFNGTVIVLADPAGTRAAWQEQHIQDSEVANRALNAGAAVIAGDLFLTGSLAPKAGPASAPANPTYAPGANPPFAAFTLGYNRSVAGNRVQDLLTLLAMARDREGVKSVRLVGISEAGPWAALARAIAGDAVDRAAIDLNQFDFDAVTEANDPMLLPGAAKYGGIYGFVPLMEHGETLLFNAKKGGAWDRAAGTKGVTLEEAKRDASAAIEWALK